MEAELARLAREASGIKNEAVAAVEEEELAAWVKAVKEAAGASTGPSPAEGPSEEEAEAGKLPATQKRRILRRVGSGAPVQPGKVVTRQGAPGEAARVTRAAAVPPADQGGTDTIIEEAAADTAAEAEKVATEEAAKTAAEDAAEGFAGETGEGAAEEAGKGAARTASVRVPAEGEAFDDEVLSAAGFEVIDEPSAGDGTQEERLLQAKSKEAVAHKVEADFADRVAEAQACFRQAHEELKATQGQLAQRDLELLLKQADPEKARDEAREEATKAEAIRSQCEAELNSQEEDLAKREADIDAKLCAKDEEVKELEVERDGLKDQTLKLAEEKDTLNGALTEAQGAILGRHDQRPHQAGLWNPDLDFDAGLDNLSGDADLSGIEERIEPISSRIGGIQRVEGQRRD
nr:uncharacterized protein CG45076-like [Aegilops tauschii subsp. strangulata]